MYFLCCLSGIRAIFKNRKERIGEMETRASDASRQNINYGSPTRVTRKRHSEEETLTHCWFNVGPASQTVGQHWTNNGSKYSVLPVSNDKRQMYLNYLIPTNRRHSPNVGLLLSQHRRRWPGANPILGQRLVFAGVGHYPVNTTQKR